MLVNQIVFEEPLISENRKPQLKRLVYKLIEKLETNESDDFYLFKVSHQSANTMQYTHARARAYTRPYQRMVAAVLLIYPRCPPCTLFIYCLCVYFEHVFFFCYLFEVGGEAQQQYLRLRWPSTVHSRGAFACFLHASRACITCLSAPSPLTYIIDVIFSAQSTRLRFSRREAGQLVALPCLCCNLDWFRCPSCFVPWAQVVPDKIFATVGSEMEPALLTDSAISPREHLELQDIS